MKLTLFICNHSRNTNWMWTSGILLSYIHNVYIDLQDYATLNEFFDSNLICAILEDEGEKIELVGIFLVASHNFTSIHIYSVYRLLAFPSRSIFLPLNYQNDVSP